MSKDNGNRALFGKKAILEYLKVGEPAFRTFIEMGMPAQVINGRWYAHKDNIDEFWRTLTRYRETAPPSDAE